MDGDVNAKVRSRECVNDLGAENHLEDAKSDPTAQMVCKAVVFPGNVRNIDFNPKGS